MNAIKAWFLILSFLFFKCYINSLIQGYARFKSKKFRHAEDVDFFMKGKGTVEGIRSALDIRASNAWRNDLENIPFFILLLLGFALIVNDSKATFIYGIIFCIFRSMHTLYMIIPKQPWRNIAYQGGFLTTVFLLVKCLIKIWV
jgi:uncharacterized MAPEG superfamily protein